MSRPRRPAPTRLFVTVALAALLLTVLAAPAVGEHAGDPSGSGVQPQYLAGNPDCGDVNDEWTDLFKFPEDPTPGGWTVTVYGEDDTLLDWESDGTTVIAVIVKGGNYANLYVYDPLATGDTGLHAPVNHQNDEYYGVSHVSFCLGEHEDVPDEDVPDEEVPDDEVPDEDIPDEEVPDEEVPDEEVPDEEVAEETDVEETDVDAVADDQVEVDDEETEVLGVVLTAPETQDTQLPATGFDPQVLPWLALALLLTGSWLLWAVPGCLAPPRRARL